MPEKDTFLGAVKSAAVEALQDNANEFIRDEVLAETEFGKRAVATLAKLSWLEFRGRDVGDSRAHLWSALRLKYREKAQSAKLAAFDASVETMQAVAVAIGRFARAAAAGAVGL